MEKLLEEISFDAGRARRGRPSRSTPPTSTRGSKELAASEDLARYVL